MPPGCVYCVRVRYNVVAMLAPVPAAPGLIVPDTKLEVSTQLARNHQMHGCIDGDYHFADADTAKYFAILCQDFVKRLVEKTMTELERMRDAPDDAWRNPYIPSAAGPRDGTS